MLHQQVVQQAKVSAPYIPKASQSAVILTQSDIQQNV